jgi:hypothetical protein
MSWKLSTLALTALTVLGVGLAAAGPTQAAKAGCPCCQSAPAAVGTVSPLAAAKPTDKELIAKQKTCPVSDQPLGAMGKPVKIVVKGRTVFLCCSGCKKKFFADVDKYLKKLDEQMAEKP